MELKFPKLEAMYTFFFFAKVSYGPIFSTVFLKERKKEKKITKFLRHYIISFFIFYVDFKEA